MLSRFLRISSALALLTQAGQSLAQTPEGFSPSTDNSLSIEYAGNSIAAGSAVPITDAATSPFVQLSQTNISRIILMFDIDAPLGPTNNSLSPLLHWLISTPSGQLELPENQTLIDATAVYSGPSPPPGAGPHRYVFLELENREASFHMPSGFPDSFEDTQNRLRFDVPRFIEDGGFHLLSATWFTAESINATIPDPESGAPMVASSLPSVIFSLACVVAAIAASV